MATLFVTLGALLLCGLLADALGQRTRLPRVTLLLLLGVAVGPIGLDLLPEEREAWFGVLANLALLMIGFLLGGEFSAEALRERGRAVMVLSGVVTVATAAVVFGVAWATGATLTTAVVLAAVATATDPAACVDVVKERAEEGRMAKVLLGVVAVDDVWGLLVFSLLLTALGMVTGSGELGALIVQAVWEIGGAVALGAALGVPMALLSGRLQPGEPTRVEALGTVLLCGGLAMTLEVSTLLAAVVLGAVVANLARHHQRAFHEIEAIETPFLMLFFLLSGASLRLDALAAAGGLGAVYIGGRVLGRLVGGAVGAPLAGLPVKARWIGAALLPQAGVALGLALVAAERFPEARQILPVVVLSTVAFELFGPVLTGRVLDRIEG